MKAVRFDTYGSPGKVLHLADLPLPAPGPGQVRLRMVLSPIHNHDLMIVSGHYGIKPPLPHVPGTEALGIVDALGEGVTRLTPGQRVAGGGTGTWAEFYLSGAESLVPVPDGIDDATACQIASMPMSAVRLLHDLEVEPGDWVIQNAANGFVGKMLARLAGERGVNVINVVRRDAAVAELAAEGIGNAVSTETEGWQDRVRELTGGAPIKRAVDSVAGRAADELMDLVADEGWLISFGGLSGRPVQLNPDNLLFKRATVKGFWAARPSTSMTSEALRTALLDIVSRAAKGTLVLPLEARFALSNVAAASAAATVAGRAGKVALRGSP